MVKTGIFQRSANSQIDAISMRCQYFQEVPRYQAREVGDPLRRRNARFALPIACCLASHTLAILGFGHENNTVLANLSQLPRWEEIKYLAVEGRALATSPKSRFLISGARFSREDHGDYRPKDDPFRPLRISGLLQVPCRTFSVSAMMITGPRTIFVGHCRDSGPIASAL